MRLAAAAPGTLVTFVASPWQAGRHARRSDEITAPEREMAPVQEHQR